MENQLKDSLEDKIREFTKKYNNTHFLSRDNVLKRFIEDELKVQQNQIVIGKKELSEMQSSANFAWQDLPTQSSYQGDKKLMLAYVWSCSVLDYLRRHGLLHAIIKIDKGV